MMPPCNTSAVGLNNVNVNSSAAVTTTGVAQSGITLVGTTGPRTASCKPCGKTTTPPGPSGPQATSTISRWLDCPDMYAA
jgi:hypothetical protein